MKLAGSLVGYEPDECSFLIATSGRYEYKNKGIDLFIEAVRRLKETYTGEKEIIAFVMVPAWSGNAREDLALRMNAVENFKTAFTNTANNLFGSGWVWLIKNKNGTLDIIGESNAGNVLKGNGKPLLGVDIWEHAYYLDYQNRRAEHIDGLWNIIDWSIVDRRYNE